MEGGHRLPRVEIAQEVACPKCKAEPGEPCKTSTPGAICGERMFASTGTWEAMKQMYGVPPDFSWDEMDGLSRHSMRDLRAKDIPTSAGVYALYRDDERSYIGKAGCLRDRVWKNHSGRGAVMTSSALRRNVAQHLGIATAADIKARRYRPTQDEVARVRDWLDGCHIAWCECEDERLAIALETAMKAEYRPPLTKR